MEVSKWCDNYSRMAVIANVHSSSTARAAVSRGATGIVVNMVEMLSTHMSYINTATTSQLSSIEAELEQALVEVRIPPNRTFTPLSFSTPSSSSSSPLPPSSLSP